MRSGQLHILIVNAAVGVDVIAEVGLVGDFTQVSLNVTDVAISDVTIAVHVADQETHGRLGACQSVALVIMHVGERDDHILRIAGLTIEGHQQHVRISRINTYAADRTAVCARAVRAGHIVIEREANREALVVAAVFNAWKWDIEGIVPVRLS